MVHHLFAFTISTASIFKFLSNLLQGALQSWGNSIRNWGIFSSEFNPRHSGKKTAGDLNKQPLLSEATAFTTTLPISTRKHDLLFSFFLPLYLFFPYRFLPCSSFLLSFSFFLSLLRLFLFFFYSVLVMSCFFLIIIMKTSPNILYRKSPLLHERVVFKRTNMS